MGFMSFGCLGSLGGLQLRGVREPVFFCFCCLVFFVVGSLEDEPGRPVSE